MGITNRLQHAWNAFREGPQFRPPTFGHGSANRPDRVRLLYGNEKSIVGSIYNRIGIDASTMLMKHVRIDQNGKYLETIDSSLNECLTLDANIDQTGRAFIQDAVMSLCDEGAIAIVPVDTTVDPRVSSTYNINTLRVGKIMEWFPTHVRVKVYNDRTGIKEDILLPKSTVAIVENPLFQVMNEPNSTLKRLIRKLNLLDSVDEQSSSGKLDLIIQLPYVIKSEARKKQAEDRRADIEMQLKGSKYGIAYTDGSEKITQLNRPAENNLLSQVEYLTSMLYGQLGLTDKVFDGTADEREMLNYYNRTIDPILTAISESLTRTFLTKTARTQKQTIMFFRDAFKLVPVDNLAEIADKFTRNEILSSNEVRGIIGYRPVDDPKADELRNKNLNTSADAETPAMTKEEENNEEG